ncbi:Chemotaxis protein [Salinisphaera shabanensis E1L3A]|uniref:Chemotaxis protein n=1 Tax=Salinisphaera shabanensis E1L3A TaxID=1033802 RepID=U2EKW3_9GAMM|nr:protein-glutamate O-methyltransferase CheR [Salinisphaera shabanensis]ERJ18892.1 Chemotaxis protein [Salinisphaera shabanensis E1L3A]
MIKPRDPDAEAALEADDIALEVFIHALKLRHGYDFSEYSRASLKRRALELTRKFGVERLGDLIPSTLYEPALVREIVSHLSVPVSSLFRDPEVFLRLREEVLPMLASWPRINIWLAGCAYGEEVYSLAIMLAEAGLTQRSQIYATDFNDYALERAAEGIFNRQNLPEYRRNYMESGGQARLSDYYHARYELMRMRRELLERVVFAHHNLVTDGVFAEAHLIMCRNVLIYFTQPLKDRVLELFADSLVRGGFLVLGNKEALSATSPVADRFELVSATDRIYRLKRDGV